MDVYHLTAPEDRDISYVLNIKYIKRRSIELHMRNVSYADGKKIWVNVTVSSIRDDENRHIGSIAIV
jgi:PAS domain S-box-containing protein